jgi:hypothetical protein
VWTHSLLPRPGTSTPRAGDSLVTFGRKAVVDFDPPEDFLGELFRHRNTTFEEGHCLVAVDPTALGALTAPRGGIGKHLGVPGLEVFLQARQTLRKATDEIGSFTEVGA